MKRALAKGGSPQGLVGVAAFVAAGEHGRRFPAVPAPPSLQRSSRPTPFVTFAKQFVKAMNRTMPAILTCARCDYNRNGTGLSCCHGSWKERCARSGMTSERQPYTWAHGLKACAEASAVRRAQACAPERLDPGRQKLWPRMRWPRHSNVSTGGLRCLFIVTTHAAQFNATFVSARLASESMCSQNAMVRLCKFGRGGECDLRTPNVGEEAHAVLSVLVDNYAEIVREFHYVVSVPATAFFRSSHRMKRAIAIARGLGRHDTFWDANGARRAFQAGFQLENWHNASLTPADPRPLTRWVSWHLRQPVGEMLLGKGIFAVPSTAVAGRSRHSYCSLLAQVSGCRHCEAGHYLERVWHAVFGGTRAFNSPPIEDLEK